MHGYFFPPIQVTLKNWVKIASKLVFIGGQNLPPPATRDAFQMLPLVGLRSAEVSFYRVHNELFGGYEGDLMLKPDDATLNRVRGTFLDFLKREDLEPMKVIFKLSQEFTGK